MQSERQKETLKFVIWDKIIFWKYIQNVLEYISKKWYDTQEIPLSGVYHIIRKM